MTDSFKKHQLSKAEKLWLQEAALPTPFDPKRAKVKLFGQIPEDFNPDTIDRRLYGSGKLTLIGRWHVTPDSPLFGAVDKVIMGVRESILTNPGVESFTATDIAQERDLDEGLVAKALHEMNQLGAFFSSASGPADSDAFTNISLTGDRAYDEYLQYKGLDALLERVYVERDPARTLSSQFDNWSYDVTDTEDIPRLKPLVEWREIKKDTAFVLMAMDPLKPDLEDVYSTIRDGCREFGIDAYRADRIEHQESITVRILKEIRTCEYLVADLTLERPNVYYEIGYAHAINKKPILFRKAGTRLHFDLAVHNVPEYKNNAELRELLRKRLTAILGREPKIP